MENAETSRHPNTDSRRKSYPDHQPEDERAPVKHEPKWFWHRCRRNANTQGLRTAIAELNALQPHNNRKEIKMSSPSGYVQLLQSDLDNFTAEINAAVSVLTGYIAQLVAGQSTPLPAADEAAITAAVASLSGLEPPAPASTS